MNAILRRRLLTTLAMLLIVFVYLLYHQYVLDERMYSAGPCKPSSLIVRAVMFFGCQMMIGILAIRDHARVRPVIFSLAITLLPVACEAWFHQQDWIAMSHPFSGLLVPWMVFIAAIGLGAALAPILVVRVIEDWEQKRSKHRRRIGRCVRCGYDLKG